MLCSQPCHSAGTVAGLELELGLEDRELIRPLADQALQRDLRTDLDAGLLEDEALGVDPAQPHRAAELDPLYDNDLNDGIDGRTEVFRKRAVLHGASVQNGNQVELVVYQNANHSFDGKNNGADGAANTAAKANTLDFLDDYLQ